MLHKHAGPAVAGSYTLGAIGGALLTATALLIGSGLLSPIPDEIRAGSAVAALVLLLLHALGVLCLDFLPQRKVQIPRETFNQRPHQAAFRFAFELGTGVRTYITAAAPYALALGLLLCAPRTLGTAVLTALAAAVGYGIGRSVVVAGQTLIKRPAVEHPTWALRTADVLAVVFMLALAIRYLISA